MKMEIKCKLCNTPITSKADIDNHVVCEHCGCIYSAQQIITLWEEAFVDWCKEHKYEL